MVSSACIWCQNNFPKFMAIIVDLTDSNTISDTRNELNKLYESEGTKVEQVKSPSPTWTLLY